MTAKISFSALQRAEIAEIWSKWRSARCGKCFSALQRAEIAEMLGCVYTTKQQRGFSALQRAEIAEMWTVCPSCRHRRVSFSALQRAEIAEIWNAIAIDRYAQRVSVLFNEPKLLKWRMKLRSVSSVL